MNVLKHSIKQVDMIHYSSESYFDICNKLTCWIILQSGRKEAEAILEDIRPSPVQTLRYGVGFAVASYALLEWEKTLQFIAIIGLSQVFSLSR
ncbi:uncharacterized protein [Populus alba]|uniref:uncharacterized protein isoform X2 n=1 Tax=Populus alba TaxID=43335 RepID=UPI003CC75038